MSCINCNSNVFALYLNISINHISSLWFSIHYASHTVQIKLNINFVTPNCMCYSYTVKCLSNCVMKKYLKNYKKNLILGISEPFKLVNFVNLVKHQHGL